MAGRGALPVHHRRGVGLTTRLARAVFVFSGQMELAVSGQQERPGHQRRKGDPLWRGPAWLTVVRDVLFLLIGSAGVVWQGFVVPRPSVPLIGVFALMMAGPGIFAAWWMIGQGGQPFGTGSPSLPPQQPPSQPPSTHSSTHSKDRG